MSDGLEYDESYREYLRPGDLRTAEDVYRWMCSPVGKRLADHRMWLLAKGEYTFMDHYCEDYVMLRERLDRERRQACRRAALEHWRRFSDVAREFRGPWARVLTGLAFCAPITWRTGTAVHRDLALALYFRAEARRQ